MTARHLVWIRRVRQILVLGLFLFLLIASRLPQDIYLEYSLAFSAEQDIRIDYPLTFFFEINPLIVVTSFLSGHKWIAGFWLAIFLVAITLFLGRIFCGAICPFGSLHHAVSACRPTYKGKKRIAINQKAPAQRVKYFLLITILVAALCGLNLAGLMDPIAFLFRSIGLAVLPAVGAGLKGFFELMAHSDIKALNLLSYGAEVLLAPIFGYEYKAFQTAWFIGLLFLVILFLNRLKPRFWCRVLCPLGAFLGIFSKFSLLQLEKDPAKCTDCQKCVQGCQGAASPHPDQIWENAECIRCFNCFEACPEDALTFTFNRSLKLNQNPDMGRRAVMTGLMSGLALPFLGKLDGRVHNVPDPRLIRPPGSLPEAEFLTLCQRCGLCMKVCPTNAINPTLSEAGMAGFWTPNLIMTQGYCEYTCTLCGSVCPTGAIREISGKQKIERPIRIGSAYFDRGRCLPWSGNGPCIVCEEHCPTSPKAIYLREDWVHSPGAGKVRLKLPFVDLRKCVGCGICETKCPVKGKPAIRVIAAGESRSLRNQLLLGY